MLGSTVVAVIALTRGGDAPAPAAVPAPISPRPAPPPPPESPATRVANAPTFEQAIALARPALTDSTDELGPGAQLLASYKKLRWADVDVAAETTLGRVEKDPALERGKRLCATGEIQRIARRDLDGRKVYVGQLRTADGDEVAFVAVGTTGDLVKRNTATLCGAVLGMSGPAVSILGMFKLDENQLPLVEQ